MKDPHPAHDHVDNSRFLEIAPATGKATDSHPHDHHSEIHASPSFGAFTLYHDQTTIFSVLTLLSATIGTGILMIPNCLAPSGIIWGTVQMAFCGILSYFSLVTLLKCANFVRLYSYQDLALESYGHLCRQVANVLAFFANWGSAVLYLRMTTELFAVTFTIIFGETRFTWLSDPKSKTLAILISTIFVLPLSLPKYLRGLNLFCVLNIIFVIYFCGLVFFEATDLQPLSKSFESTNLFQWAGFYTTFPSSVVAYMSHNNVLDVFQELPKPDLRKMINIVRFTITFVFVSYVFVGIIGYATFSENIDILSNTSISNGIILTAYGYTLSGEKRPYSVAILISLVTMTLSIVISQPFNVIPAKESLKNFFKPFEDAGRFNSNESDFERFKYISITIYTGVIVAIFFDSIQLILDLIGSSFFCLVCFVFPSLFYLKIFKYFLTPREKVIHWIMIIANTIFAIWNTYENVSRAIA